jgi:hypothetical protein
MQLTSYHIHIDGSVGALECEGKDKRQPDGGRLLAVFVRGQNVIYEDGTSSFTDDTILGYIEGYHCEGIAIGETNYYLLTVAGATIITNVPDEPIIGVRHDDYGRSILDFEGDRSAVVTYGVVGPILPIEQFAINYYRCCAEFSVDMLSCKLLYYKFQFDEPVSHMYAIVPKDGQTDPDFITVVFVAKSGRLLKYVSNNGTTTIALEYPQPDVPVSRMVCCFALCGDSLYVVRHTGLAHVADNIYIKPINKKKRAV